MRTGKESKKQTFDLRYLISYNNYLHIKTLILPLRSQEIGGKVGWTCRNDDEKGNKKVWKELSERLGLFF